MESPHHPDEAAPPEPAPTPPFRVIALLAHDGQEPPAGMTDREASAAWVGATAAWHPALLAQADDLPRLENVEIPPDPQAGDLFLVANGQMGALDPETIARAEAAGVPIVQAPDDRLAAVRAILERSPDPSIPVEPIDPIARDFLALGAAHWWLRDLTNAMGHVDTLSRSHLLREAVNGAKAWRAGDANAATNRLRACFELLTEARERLYPLDGYILDLCLLDPATPAGQLALALEHHTPVTILAPAIAIEVMADREPELAQKLRDAIGEGWADVVGGAYAEVDEPFLPWSSLVWQFRKGSEVYRRHLDDRNVEALARRRFGLYPQLPQIARRFGLRFGIYGALDSGRFPVPVDSKRLWASPDGSTLESITRSPIAADRPLEGAKLAWRLGKSMRDDPSATLAMAHWPAPVAPWFEDFRRSAAYSPTLSRWVTIHDFFHRSDRPFEEVQPTPEDYAPAYLIQAAAKRDPSPISRRARHLRDRAGVDAYLAVHALAASLAESEAVPIGTELEDAMETGKGDLGRAIGSTGEAEAGRLARQIGGEGTGGRAGYLVLNPTGVTRRARVLLPDAAPDLRPEGPLRVAQYTEEGVWAVVDLPPFGFSWVPRESKPGHSPTPLGVASIRDRTLANESMTVTIDPTTGGIRGLQSIPEETARIGQQLVIAGLIGPDGKPAPSRMRATSVNADYGGPALAQATSIGTIHDPLDDRKLASFRQRFRLWAGRPTLEVDIRLSDLDPAWLARMAESDPWTHHLACRWAWPDSQSTLRRTTLHASSATEVDRPETAEAFDITSRLRRTALLFGGLAHHRRQGARMLDTILVAGSESGRDFQLGVALDLEHNFPATIDLVSPAFVVPTDAGPPRSGATGWLLQVDHKAIAILRLEFTANAGERGAPGLIVDLIETAGKAARCKLRAFRDPTRARQVDGHGDHIVDLPLDGDGALVDLTPHEIARVELSLGSSPID